MVWLKSGGLGVGDRILFVQAHGRALVHAHVGIAQQASGLTLDAFGIQGVQLLWGHFQVGLHLWTGGHLGDVESILPSCKATCTISRKKSDHLLQQSHSQSYSQCILSVWKTACLDDLILHVKTNSVPEVPKGRYDFKVSVHHLFCCFT